MTQARSGRHSPPSREAGSAEGDSRTVTRLLLAWGDGDRGALDALTPLVYSELRRLAQSHFRGERSDHTLEGTVLVHETYLKLVDQNRVKWKNRAHFFAIAARMMRRILVDHARAHNAAKRGSGQRIAIDDAHAISEPRDADLIALDAALARLAEFDPRQTRIVELRFFGGLTLDETAEVMSLSRATIKREWSVAKAWLYGQLAESPNTEPTSAR